MKFSTFVSTALAATIVGAQSRQQTLNTLLSNYVFERLDKDNAMLLVVDIQVGLSQMVRDIPVRVFRNNILAHSALAKLFSLPVVLTSSSDTGPNGPLFKEILAMHPDAAFIRREGEIDAWDNPEFQAAVKATNKTQVIIAGIITDVCTTFCALSLREEGYSVWANTEASGTYDEKIAFDANRRMELAGVHLMGTFALISDLMRDWRNTPGALEVLPFLDQYQIDYGAIARGHGYAVENGTIIPGEQEILG